MTTTASSELKWRGYAVHDTKKYMELTPIDFEPKKFDTYDIDIKVNVCGICSSDVHTVTGGWGEPILPMITGHEIAGTVARVGPDVTEFKVGDRVGVGAQVCSCFKCKPCKTDNENYCVEGGVDTYNAKYENGDIAHGGYSTAIRVHERFVFAIPSKLADEDAASMMCGGLTVFSPLKRYGVGPGKKVAIVGIGGLGHYAVQFAHVMGAEVTAFSHQADKEQDARKMGADNFVLTTKKDFAKDFAFYFDFILSTVDDASGLPLTDLLPMLDVGAHFHSVGLPDKPLPELQFQNLASNNASISVSHIGSKKEANEMLKLAAEKGVKTWVEVLPMKDAGKGIQGVKDNKVRYRYLLKGDL